MKDRAVVIVKRDKDNSVRDFDIPLNITLHEFLQSLYSIYGLKTDMEKMGMMHLSVEKPIVLLKGNKTLKEYGLRDGSTIYLTE